MTDRAYIRLSGDDRISFLQGILTQDVSKLAAQKIQFAGLLSPQGKLLHDMFLIDLGDAMLIDTDAENAPTLRKRLMMYKLRAKVVIDEGAPSGLTLPDPRHPALPPYGTALPDAERIALGIPAFGVDIKPDTITAMDAGYDLLNAISFTKGCYVGQEVTARMHYKNIARKGFFIVNAEAPLAAGAELKTAGRTLGTLTSVAGTCGLIFLKFDDARQSGFTVDNAAVTLAAPAWMQPKFAPTADSDAMQ